MTPTRRIPAMVATVLSALLASAQKHRYFNYARRARAASRRFLAGECPMLTGQSSLFAEARRAGIDVGIHPLPH